jgi:hypothetical protein
LELRVEVRVEEDEDDVQKAFALKDMVSRSM